MQSLQTGTTGIAGTEPVRRRPIGPVVLVTGRMSGCNRLLTAMLNLGGLDSYEAVDGPDALARVRAGGCAALVTTLDVGAASGIELIEQAKQFDGMLSVFVIRERDPAADEIAYLLACDGVFGPPLKGALVVATIKAVLRAKELT